jgi:hypothetical protein
VERGSLVPGRQGILRAVGMKLFIEVEISPEELPVAAELFKTLR